jgi:hypothetical protein
MKKKKKTENRKQKTENRKKRGREGGRWAYSNYIGARDN